MRTEVMDLSDFGGEAQFGHLLFALAELLLVEEQAHSAAVREQIAVRLGAHHIVRQRTALFVHIRRLLLLLRHSIRTAAIVHRRKQQESSG